MADKEIVSKFEIIIGDILEKLDDYINFFDLIIADPPFGLEFDKSSHEYGADGFILYEDKFTFKEYEEFSYKWISKCYNALKKNGSMYVISGWTNIDAILNGIRRTEFILKNHNIWFYEWGVYTKRKYVTSHYHIPFLVKDEKNYTFNPYTINPKTKRKGLPYEKDVWYWPKYNRGNDPDHIKGHPCQLPIILMKHMIKISTNPGDWIGDIFSGSGGTLLACRELGRNCISIEKNSDYLEIIKKKVRANKIIAYNPEDKTEEDKKIQVKLESFSDK
ncbi:MAG: DNA-methyltransferase [Candidatus Hermodarchaeota archaeon]